MTNFKSGSANMRGVTEVDTFKNIPIEEYLYAMRSRGYYLIRGGLSDPKLLKGLKDDLDNAFDSDQRESELTGEKLRFTDIVHHLLGRGMSFFELWEYPLITDLIDKILGSTCIVHSYNGVRLLPGRLNNASIIHRDSPRFSPAYTLAVQALVMVDRFTAENGATLLLPGSHNVLERPSDEYFQREAICIEGQPGDVIIFDSSVWHRGGENRSTEPRRGITFVFTRSFMKQQIDLPRSVSADVISSLSPRGRRLLGMNTRVPASLGEFFLPPDERLYLPNQG